MRVLFLEAGAVLRVINFRLPEHGQACAIFYNGLILLKNICLFLLGADAYA